MFSADITWTPMAEDSAAGKKDKEEIVKEKDTESLESKNSRSSKRLRWPFSKKPNTGEHSRRSSGAQSPVDGSAQPGLMLSSEVELPGDSTPWPKSYPKHGHEYYAVQESATQQSTFASSPKDLRQNENQTMDQSGMLPAVQEVFELPASTTLSGFQRESELRDQSLILKGIGLHQRSSSSLASSSATASSPPLSYLRLSPDQQFARTDVPAKTPPIPERASLRNLPPSKAAGPDDDDIASEPTMIGSNSRSSSTRTSVSQGTGFASPRSLGMPSRSIRRKGFRSQDLGLPGIDSSYLYRMISRMASASPKTILNRIEEDWKEDSLDDRTLGEIDLERRLWVLTVFSQRCLNIKINSTATSFGPRLPLSALNRADRILELAHDIAELHHLAALQPNARITYISTSSHSDSMIHLPSNVERITISPDSAARLPLADSSFDHVRACSLPSAFPASKLKGMLQECYRLLVPRGALELHIMDPIPCPDAGPELRRWIDDNLTLNLEKAFICQRPALLIPLWVKEIGFSLFDGPEDIKNSGKHLETQQLEFPIVPDSSEVSSDTRLESEVGHSMWQDMWGSHVQSEGEGFKWFWEQESVASECMDKRSSVQCRIIFAYKI